MVVFVNSYVLSYLTSFNQQKSRTFYAIVTDRVPGPDVVMDILS